MPMLRCIHVHVHVAVCQLNYSYVHIPAGVVAPGWRGCDALSGIPRQQCTQRKHRATPSPSMEGGGAHRGQLRTLDSYIDWPCVLACTHTLRQVLQQQSIYEVNTIIFFR